MNRSRGSADQDSPPLPRTAQHKLEWNNRRRHHRSGHEASHHDRALVGIRQPRRNSYCCETENGERRHHPTQAIAPPPGHFRSPPLLPARHAVLQRIATNRGRIIDYHSDACVTTLWERKQ